MADVQNRRAKYIARYNTLGFVAAFVALAWASTAFVRIPILGSGGYFNIGDTFVMAAALLFGPVSGLLVGLIGPTIADVMGYVQFAPATAIIKGTEGLVVGLIAFREQGVSAPRCAAGLFTGAAIIVAGYFVFEAYIYPFLATYSPFFDATNFGMAVAELFPNILQAVISAILAFGIWKLFGMERRFP